MDKYINADKMLKDVLATKEITDSISIDGIINYIKENATEDVMPVRHSHWIIYSYVDPVEGKSDVGYQCACCRMLSNWSYDKCPSCHAIMDKKKESLFEEIKTGLKQAIDYEKENKK